MADAATPVVVTTVGVNGRMGSVGGPNPIIAARLASGPQVWSPPLPLPPPVGEAGPPLPGPPPVPVASSPVGVRTAVTPVLGDGAGVATGASALGSVSKGLSGSVQAGPTESVVELGAGVAPEAPGPGISGAVRGWIRSGALVGFGVARETTSGLGVGLGVGFGVALGGFGVGVGVGVGAGPTWMAPAPIVSACPPWLWATNDTSYWPFLKRPVQR